MNENLKYRAVTTHPYVEVEEWCVENIGEWDKDWYKLGIDPLAWTMGDHESEWWFADEKSAVLFKLKWS